VKKFPDDDQYEFSKKLINVWRQAIKGEEALINSLKEFKRAIEALDPQYQGIDEHDAFELLGLIIQKLDEEFTNTGQSVDKLCPEDVEFVNFKI